MHNFPETPVTLCSVHIIRNLMKQLKTYTTGDFYKNPVLLKFWRILTGSLFLNLNFPEILSEILRYFKFDILTDENLENPLKNQLQKYIDQYLIKYYFDANSQFNFTLFNYYENTNVGNYNFSTNSLESLNRRLKEACGAGQLPLKKLYVRLRDFKKMYLGKFTRKVKRNQMNQRRPKTVRRQEKLEAIYDVYKNFSLDEQVSEAVSTAYQIGTLDKIQMQFSFVENNEQTQLPSDSD